MNLSKSYRLTASVMTSVFALSLFAGGCAQPAKERAAESNGALVSCDPGDDDDDGGDEGNSDIPLPMTDKELEDARKNQPKEQAPPPRPIEATPETLPSDGRISPKATTSCACADGDSPRRAALKQAVKERNEGYEKLGKKLTAGGMIGAAAGYAALRVKNGKPPTNGELGALGITLTAALYVTYYGGVLDIEEKYKRDYEAAMKLSNEKPMLHCDAVSEVVAVD